MFSSHLRLCLPIGHFPSGIPTKILHAPVVSFIRSTFPAHLILLDLITRKNFCQIFEKCKILNFMKFRLLGAELFMRTY
jgi:hypothetical protein